MIALRNMSRRYGHVRALSHASLDIDGGEFVSIVGPSGSGKTTLLSAIGGLLTPTEGEVLVDGSSLYQLPPGERVAFRRKHFGFIFQTFNLLTYLTVVENVEVPLYLAGATRCQQRETATELLHRVGLEHRMQHLPSQLSAGEQQRVAIARALANSPSVVLADEPTGNLDSGGGHDIMKQLQSLNADGVTVLLVTHDTDMAGFASRQVRINDGRVVS
ncbi:MAG: ABC transporter ATP-binding protein [Chloroflexota bacterium]